MPRYKVLTPIEHNQTLYLPEDSQAPASAKSLSHGMDIPVDASGTIELDEVQASSFVQGQIAALPTSSSRNEESKRQRGRTQR